MTTCISASSLRYVLLPLGLGFVLAACGPSGTDTDGGVSDATTMMTDSGSEPIDAARRQDAGRDAARVDSGPRFGCTGAGCNIVELSLAFENTCARRENGNVLCWGRGQEGQLGDGVMVHDPGCPTSGETPTDCSDQPIPVELPMGAEVLRARNAFQTCAKVGSTWQCWGDRFYTLEGETPEVLFSPRVQAFFGNADDISPGAGHACWLQGTTARCVGSNGAGQLATGDATAQRMPVIPMRGVFPMMPDAGPRDAGPPDAGALIDAAVLADAGQLDGGALDAALVDAGVAPVDAASVDASAADAAMMTDAGRVMLEPLTGVTQIVTGFGYTCARTSDAVYCWGANRYGQLGDGIAHQQCFEGSDRFDCAPYAVRAAVPNASNVTDLALGNEFVCALRSTGVVSCWGGNEAGQLGQGNNTDVDTVVDVPGITDAVQIAAGGGFICARRMNGTVSCWGSNRLGQLGNGMMGPNTCTDGANDFVCGTSPQTVSGLSDATFIATGRSHACAIRQAGGVVCWGSGDRFELGNRARGEQRTPVPVMNLP